MVILKYTSLSWTLTVQCIQYRDSWKRFRLLIYIYNNYQILIKYCIVKDNSKCYYCNKSQPTSAKFKLITNNSFQKVIPSFKKAGLQIFEIFFLRFYYHITRGKLHTNAFYCDPRLSYRLLWRVPSCWSWTMPTTPTTTGLLAMIDTKPERSVHHGYQAREVSTSWIPG